MEANWKYCKTCIDVTYDSTKIFLKEIFKLTKLKLDFFFFLIKKMLIFPCDANTVFTNLAQKHF